MLILLVFHIKYAHFSPCKGFYLVHKHRSADDAYIWKATLSKEFVCLRCVRGHLNNAFSVCWSERSEPYQGSNLLHHRHNARPFIHTHPGYSWVINFRPGHIPVSIKLGMFRQLIYSARVRQVCTVTSS